MAKRAYAGSLAQVIQAHKTAEQAAEKPPAKPTEEQPRIKGRSGTRVKGQDFGGCQPRRDGGRICCRH